MAGLDLLKQIAPELEGEDDERLETFVEMASMRISAKVFGKVYPQAVAYLAAHLVTVSNRGRDQGVAAAGQVQQMRTGGQSISFGSSGAASGGSTGDEALASTPYGQEFLTLRNSRARTKGLLIR